MNSHYYIFNGYNLFYYFTNSDINIIKFIFEYYEKINKKFDEIIFYKHIDLPLYMCEYIIYLKKHNYCVNTKDIKPVCTSRMYFIPIKYVISHNIRNMNDTVIYNNNYYNEQNKMCCTYCAMNTKGVYVYKCEYIYDSKTLDNFNYTIYLSQSKIIH